MSRFPPLTQESRICRDGAHRTVLTRAGRRINTALNICFFAALFLLYFAGMFATAEALWRVFNG